jgi:hypothetical protein
MTDDKKPPARAPAPETWQELAAWAQSALPTPAPPPPPPATWQELLGTAILAGLVGAGIAFLARAAEQGGNARKASRGRPIARPIEPLDPAVSDAAELLGVPVDASGDEIRAAFRRRFAEDRVHPDQGGDEETAKRLTAAKNLLFERRRGSR